ncbi:uncharacterized protein LOC117129770 isoform X2 [Brassica rapa]|uniref:uncharacterized protein LOC117129770 isoform X2 n=1 Tax=Brassica campestris TaxID=3711 RepID=UPI00142E1B81|nr:uncharacterized protein LOC117129770 isoform X2 [Brassica rapa]
MESHLCFDSGTTTAPSSPAPLFPDLQEHLFVLSIQERQVQPLNESTGRAQQPQIWRSFVVQTGYLGASDRGSVQEGYLNSLKVFCFESNFIRKPTHQGFTEAWNRMKNFTDEEVMNFPNQRFFSPSIREYQISKGYSCPIKKRPEPKPIIGFQMDLPASQKDRNQKEWPWDLEVMIHPPKPARPKTALPPSFSQQTRGISKTSKFICADESVKFHDRKHVTIDVPMELECFLPSFHFYDLKENPTKEAAKCSPHEKQLELMILHDPNVFPQSTSCPKQKYSKDHELISSTLHENVLKPRISKRKHILTWLKNVLLKPFHELISLSCALKEIWCRKEHELKLLRPKNSFDFVHDDNFSNLALSLSFHNSFSHWPDFEIDKSIFGNQLTCLMLSHVLDDYPKCLDPVFGVLRIEKPFDYSFTRFDVVSLVALNKQDKHDQFLRRASTNGRQITWNSLMKMTSKLQGSFCPYFSFPEFSMNFNSFVSDSSFFDIGTLDLRTNPFEEGGNDTPRSTDQYMEPNQPGDQNVLNISTEVHVFHRTGQTDRAVYWTVPHTSGKELWLEPWPDDRSDHTGACLSRPTSHLKTYGRARIHFGRAGRGDTYLELDELSELSDTTLELDELSELNDTSLELNELSNTEDGAGSAAGRNGPFQPKEKFIKSSLWDCFFPNPTSPFLSPFKAHSHQVYQEGVSKEVLVVHGKKNSIKIINFGL